MKLHRVVAQVITSRRQGVTHTRKLNVIVKGVTDSDALQAAGRRLAAEGLNHNGLRIAKSFITGAQA